MEEDKRYDQIERVNIANIVAKLKEGKTLTASDRRALENQRRKEAGLRPQKTDVELAKEFDVDKRGSIARWKKLGAPFGGTDAEVYHWLIDNGMRGADDWKNKFRKENPGDIAKKKNTKSKARAKTPPIKTAEELRDEYLKELQTAKDSGDEAREKVALNNYLKINKNIRESEAHAKRLGLDSGEVLPRSEVEKILRATFWAANACCDKFSKQIAQRLSDKKAPEIHAILKPLLVGITLFEGMRRLAKTPGDVNLPSWIIKCAETERKHYLKP